MVRIATVNDAEQLNILNNEFNGEGDTSIDNIRAKPHKKDLSRIAENVI